MDPTSICNGVSPNVARSQTRIRPFNAESAKLLEVEYDGESSDEAVLTLIFSESVEFEVNMSSLSFDVAVSVGQSADGILPLDSALDPKPLHRLVEQPKTATADWAVNLMSLQRTPTVADVPQLQPAVGETIYYTEVLVHGKNWYRVRLGNFDTAALASQSMRLLRQDFPNAWIEQTDPDLNSIELISAQRESPVDESEPSNASTDAVSKVDSLMDDARKAMLADETSRAIQIYTKVLQQPAHPRHPEAQEFLARAREKNGQMAHAKAEYERYLSLYPNEESAARVSQRLAAMLATRRASSGTSPSTDGGARSPSPRVKNWRIQTFFSQYYRRDANQQNDQEEIVSQSALYSDINFDARRRGQRFDFSSRISAGYRNDFLDDGANRGSAMRVSYAYADLADASSGLRARIGRQSRNSGGILGRFDGLNLGYEAGENFLVNAVYGRPAYSSNDGVDSTRSFYGASATYRPPLDGLELGIFYLEQEIEGITDRQAVGGEFRYFGENQSVWGLVDYDTSYDELGSAFLQASWRFASRLSLHGSYDRRHSPYLSAGNALIGQPVLEFSDLLELFPVEELRQFGLDRSPLSTSVTIGLSHSLSPRFQINADFSQSTIESTPASGGVEATPANDYRYFSTSVVASSLLKEGDVTILTTRYSDSGNSQVISLLLDSRYPIRRSLRINPRLRVDRRQRLSSPDYEWLYTPAIRIQYRRSQKFRIDLEAGKQFSQHDALESNLDRESYFINVGYQVFF